MRIRPVAAALATAVVTCILGADAAEDPSIATYQAAYEAEYKGKSVGTSQISVTYDAARDVYTYESRTTPKGFIKLVAPNPAVERSEFRADDGAIVPLTFRYEDGSRKGEDNYEIEFDWDKSVAVVKGAGGHKELPLAPGVLDRGTLQVALMRDVANGAAPGTYQRADDDAISPYAYVPSGEQTIATGAGELDTVAYTQQREGSSRTTELWLAPAHGYVPARIEQRRNGELQTALTLQSVTLAR